MHFITVNMTEKQAGHEQLHIVLYYQLQLRYNQWYVM